jgi:hypothetical protein
MHGLKNRFSSIITKPLFSAGLTGGPRTFNATLCDEFQLFFEDGEHGFAFGAVHLGESGFDDFAIVGTAVMEELSKAEGAVAEEDLGVFEALIVIGHAEVELVGEVLNLLKEVGGLIGVASRILLHAEFGHLVDELGVEEALLAGLSGWDTGLKGGDGGLINGFVVWI